MKVKLECFLQEVSERTTENNQYPVLTSSKAGLYLQSDYFNKQVASKDNTGYKIIKKGQFTYRAMSDTGEFFPNMLECADIGIVSPAYPVFEIVKPIIIPEFLKYYFKSNKFQQSIALFAQGSTRTSIKYEKLKKVLMELPDLNEQQRCVEILDAVQKNIDDRKNELEKLDDLIQARFVEMFGDMWLNSKNLPEVRLDEIADIVSGITKGRKVKEQKLFKVPYMAVSNVKDGYIDWTTVKTIMASQAEIDKYQLKPFDVLMTEGGDPDKVGRGAIIHVPPENCIHQNHIFRVRLNRVILLPEYMEQYLQQQKAKRYFLGCAKQTTGIASINMRQLTGLPVLIPEMQLQERYADFVHQTNKYKLKVEDSLKKLEILQKSLMQQYFG